MSKEDIRHMVESELQPGEEVLWAHVIPQGGAKALSPGTRSIIQIVMVILWLGIAANFVRIVMITPSEELGDMLKKFLPLILLFGAGHWFFTKTEAGKKIDSATKRAVFENGIVTNRRILFYNHSNSKRDVYEPDEVGAVSIDYENGGYALKIEPKINSKPSLLIGIADFEKAVDIINSRLLVKGDLS